MSQFGQKAHGGHEGFGSKLMHEMGGIGSKLTHGLGSLGAATSSLAMPLSVLATAAGQPEIAAGLMTASKVGSATAAPDMALRKMGV
jgi:hypothetical protein